MRRLQPLAIPLRGRHLIEASAGTGKTFTITTLLLRLIIERDLDIDRILVVTFTKAATAELRARVRKRLREALESLDGDSHDEVLTELLARVDAQTARARITRALSMFDLASIFTIHGFCQRVLSEHAFESGQRFGLELLSDTSGLLLDAVRDEYVRALSAAPPSLAKKARSSLSIAELSALIRTATASPDMILETDAAPANDAALKRYFEVRAEFARNWPGQGEAVRELVLRPGVLNRSRYRERRVDQALAEADRIAGADGAQVDDIEQLHILSPEVLKSAVNQGQRVPEHRIFASIGRLVEAHAAAAGDLDARLCHLQLSLAKEVAVRLRTAKQERSVRSFDDLLVDLRNALRAEGETLSKQLRARYPVALVDEFQDTDPVQYEILNRVYSTQDSALFLIGDPKQAIYAFRGADVFSYLEASRAAGDNRFGLTTSYRADPSLVQAQNTLFEGVALPFVDEGIAYASIEARPGAMDAMSGWDEPRPALDVALLARAEPDSHKLLTKTRVEAELPARIARDIRALLGSGVQLGNKALRPGDIAVLTRTNRQAAEMQVALSRISVPAVLVGDRSVFESAEATELALVMRALAEPGKSAAVRTALFMPCLGFDASMLVELERSDTLWEQWASRFARLHEVWKGRGFIHAFHTLFREARAPQRLLSFADGERKLTNLLHLAELLHQAAVEQHLGVAGLLRYMDEAIADGTALESLAPDAQQLRLESDAAAVSVTTVHKSKGLEYPVVYLPSLWVGDVLRDDRRLRYHDSNRGGALVMHIAAKRDKEETKRDPRYQRAERESLAEAMRVGYVGLTRAKHHAVAVFGRINTAGTSALGRLLLTRGKHRGASAEQRLKALDDHGLRGVLDALHRESAGSIGRRALARAEETFSVAPLAPTAALSARQLERRLDFQYRTSSFTALTRGAEASLAPAPEHDHDAGLEPAALRPAPAPVVLAQFPRGARAGECLHRIFELIDFDATDPEPRAATVRRVLTEYGIDPRQHAASVDRAVSDVLNTPLVGDMCLKQIGRAERQSEMEFVFPVREQSAALSAAALGRAFAEHARRPISPDYAQSVCDLGFLPLAGALRGFIDLAFSHDGRFYLADYKSNFLGAAATDYAPDILAREMQRHHYVLQYHLYCVALHRYLAVRVPDYDYERHFGGVAYLFLRGMQPTAAGSGVYFDRPSEAMLDGLSAVIAKAEEAP